MHHKPVSLILASASPRRRELLPAILPLFITFPANIRESASAARTPREAVAEIAEAKARAVRALRPGALVLAADTLVVLDGVTLGKPRDAAEARLFLRKLRGRAHTLVTAVMLLTGDRLESAIVGTEVKLRPYSEAEISRTIASGAPFDKAGAYGIQDLDFRPVESWAGCYCNVLGLPLWDTRMLLQSACPKLQIHEPNQSYNRCEDCPRRSAIASRP